MIELKPYEFKGMKIPAAVEKYPGVAKLLPLDQWLGFGLPADTPKDILDKVTEAFKKTMESDLVKDLARTKNLALYGYYGEQSQKVVFAWSVSGRGPCGSSRSPRSRRPISGLRSRSCPGRGSALGPAPAQSYPPPTKCTPHDAQGETATRRRGDRRAPVLTLTVPGSPPAAMLLGAIWLHGVRPGPMLGFEFPHFMPQIAATLFWASIAMLIMGLFMSRITVLVLKTPPALFMPVVVFFCVLAPMRWPQDPQPACSKIHNYASLAPDPRLRMFLAFGGSQASG